MCENYGWIVRMQIFSDPARIDGTQWLVIHLTPIFGDTSNGGGHPMCTVVFAGADHHSAPESSSKKETSSGANRVLIATAMAPIRKLA